MVTVVLHPSLQLPHHASPWPRAVSLWDPTLPRGRMCTALPSFDLDTWCSALLVLNSPLSGIKLSTQGLPMHPPHGWGPTAPPPGGTYGGPWQEGGRAGVCTARCLSLNRQHLERREPPPHAKPGWPPRARLKCWMLEPSRSLKVTDHEDQQGRKLRARDQNPGGLQR